MSLKVARLNGTGKFKPNCSVDASASTNLSTKIFSEANVFSFAADYKLIIDFLSICT